MDVGWKRREKNSWDTLLSSAEVFAKELNKPYSYGALWTFIYRKNFEIIVKMIGGTMGQRILNIGCGSGWLDKWIAEEGGIPIGIDISSAFLKISKIRAQHGKYEIDLICADGDHLPFRDNAFNYAVAYQSLHHFPRPETVIHEALRCSKNLVLGDEPATIPLPKLVLKFFKRISLARMHVEEVSGIEETRFDPKELESIYMMKGYQVYFERIWSYVPAIFTRLEKLRITRIIYEIGYLILMNVRVLRRLGHGFIMVVQKRKTLMQ